MFIRAAILYVIIIVIMRAMGKRQIEQLQPYELVITILIADLASTPMEDSTVPLLYGIMPLAALLLFHALLTFVTLKSGRLREIINGQPSVIIRNGVVDEKELRKQGVTLSELLEEIRSAGMNTIDEVGCAVLEVSGQVSIFPTSQMRPVQPSDLQIPTSYESIPLPVILDGRVQVRSLQKGGLDRAWLESKMTELRIPVSSVFLCLLDTNGRMTIQEKGKNEFSEYQALDPKEVSW